MTPEATQKLIDLGVLGILLIAALAAVPVVWRFFRSDLWKRGTSREDGLYNRLDKKDEALLKLTEETTRTLASNTEVVRQNSATIQQGQATHVQFAQMVERMISSVDDHRRFIDTRMDQFENNLNQTRQVMESGARITGMITDKGSTNRRQKSQPLTGKAVKPQG